MKKSFEDLLNEYGVFSYTNKGFSMYPMLRPDKDVFTIAKIKDLKTINVGDVVLYRRGKDYVLHRVIDVSDDTLTTQGDHCVFPDKEIRISDVLGIMTAFKRGKKIIYTDNKLYRFYVFVIILFQRIRKFHI